MKRRNSFPGVNVPLFHSQLRSLAQGECQQALKSLQTHYEDFVQDSRDSELFSVSDRLRLEEEVESSKEHIRQLLESMENGELQRADAFTRSCGDS